MTFTPNDYQGIFYLGKYHPYREKDTGNKNPYFDNWSGYILDLKQKKESAIQLFFKELNPMIESGIAIAVVPSHDPDSTLQSGIYKLAQELANNNRIDATHCLKRHTKIRKLSHGGDRNIGIHLQSIRVENNYLIQKQAVCLLDDISTTGNSLEACRQLLLQAGAKMVKCIALGKTVRFLQEDESEEF
jgi:predicted amidophosphoribosyltransferase